MISKVTVTVLILLISTSSLAGNIISPEESEKILRETLAATPACIVIDELAELPVAIDTGSLSTRKAERVLLAMTDAGLLKMEKKQVEMNKKSTYGMKQKVKVNAHVYSMTDMGEKFYRVDAQQVSRGGSPPKVGSGFCYAEKLELTEIKNSLGGGTVINYYLHVPDKAAWANNEKIISTGLIADKRSMQVTSFKLAAQEEPPIGLKAQAQFKKQPNGEYVLTHY